MDNSLIGPQIGLKAEYNLTPRFGLYAIPKMGIYGKYLPLIAKFSQELAGEKHPPKYKQLIREEQEVADAEEIAAQELTVEVGGKEGVKGQHEQAKIEDYS